MAIFIRLKTETLRKSNESEDEKSRAEIAKWKMQLPEGAREWNDPKEIQRHTSEIRSIE